MAEKCTCGSLLGRQPEGIEGWQPIAGPQPDPPVRIVARYGDNPRDRRAERTRPGWVRRGARIERPHMPGACSRIGRCSAGRSHWVVPRPGGPAMISRWEVRLFVSSGSVRRRFGQITIHRGEEGARTLAERGLERLRAQWRGVGQDTCFVATVERQGERITCYLLPEGALDWDAVRDRG